LLADFSGHEPDKVKRVADPPIDVALAVGKLDGVLYSTVRDGKHERYIHRFKKSSRPLLAVSSDGKKMRMLGGAFQFTEAGIEDR
jgi:hypothetical protein